MYNGTIAKNLTRHDWTGCIVYTSKYHLIPFAYFSIEESRGEGGIFVLHYQVLFYPRAISIINRLCILRTLMLSNTCPPNVGDHGGVGGDSLVVCILYVMVVADELSDSLTGILRAGKS